jgi:hypothetical protein
MKDTGDVKERCFRWTRTGQQCKMGENTYQIHCKIKDKVHNEEKIISRVDKRE